MVERLQNLNEACIKKEELIKTQGEYMQSIESQIYELQSEIRQKDQEVRKLNDTIQEQRDYLENRHSSAQFLNSFDGKMEKNSGHKRNIRSQGGNSFHNSGDEETIEDLKEDIKQLLKEYKLIEKQKDDLEHKYEDTLQKNDELIREVMNMENIIDDQDAQIRNMREKLQQQEKELKMSQVYQKQMTMINRRFDSGVDSVYDVNVSNNLSRQINLEDFREARDSGKAKFNPNFIDEKAIEDVLNVSYQIINPEGGRKEQSFIEEKLNLRKARGITPFRLFPQLPPLLPRNKGNNTDSTADGDSKTSKNKYSKHNRSNSIGKNIVS